MSYGPDELYTRFSQRSLGLWKAFFVGEFTAERVLKGDATHPRFTLASKHTEQKRSVH